MKEIVARFETKCPSCRGQIASGSTVLWERGRKAVHITCPVQESLPSSDAQVAQDGPTEKQAAFIRKLADERESTIGSVDLFLETLKTPNEASAAIDVLLSLPEKPGGGVVPEGIDVGMYQVDGDVFKVQRSKADRLYAKRLVPVGPSAGDRLSEEDVRVDWDWEYASGAILKLRPEARMTEADAKAFGTKYGVCAACGKRLTVAESVEAGVGPVCRKWFRW